jgi:tRNA uridine 5-carbamoylmethylation protein Kti12
MKHLILVCGPAGIGKSTFCQKYISEHPDENVKMVSSDEIRKQITQSYTIFPKDKNGAKDMAPVYNGMVDLANSLAKANDNLTVLLDSTMLNDQRRLFFADRIVGYDVIDLYLLKLHDYSLCFKRNHERIKEKWVPDEVIADMIKSYEDPTPEVAKKFAHVEVFYLD